MDTLHINVTIVNEAQTKTGPTTLSMDYQASTANEATALNDYYSQSDVHGQHAHHVVVYPGFAFEVPVYLYIWPVLVLVTCGLNIVVFVVLLKKKMRSSTNTILAAISVSDSLTGLVTIPVYLMVYSKWEGGSKSTGQETANYTYDEYDYSEYDSLYKDYFTNMTHGSEQNDVAKAAYILSPSLCRSFNLTRHFISMTFHTISIWLTLFLGFQRFCGVIFPFRSLKWLNKRNIIIACVIVCLTAPVLHVFHLFDEKVSDHGFCEWKVTPGCVDFDCVYIWLTLIFKQVIPCTVLLVLTILFVLHLKRGSKTFERKDSYDSRRDQRKRESRRISAIVILIVIFFLIPEVPYGMFYMYIAVCSTFSIEMDLETNREITAAYEILVVLSFHTNFWIYLGFNARFRDELKLTLSSPLIEIHRRLSSSSRGSFSKPKISQEKQMNECNIELHEIERGEHEKLNRDHTL